MTTLPVDVSDDVKDEPDAAVAVTVAETTFRGEGEAVVFVGSRPGICISIRRRFPEANMRRANEALLFGKTGT